jgi:hypothetical protein
MQGRALDSMMTARAPLIPRGKNREFPAKLVPHSEELRQLGRVITHLAAQHSCRTALHGSLGTTDLLSKDSQSSNYLTPPPTATAAYLASWGLPGRAGAVTGVLSTGSDTV